MGHHYVPQAYLRAFESSPGSGHVWMFDRTTEVHKHVPIVAVAQSSGYYEGHVERDLSKVEGPAHAVIARVLKDHRVSTDDRDILAYYVAVMMYRVPRRRRKGKDMIPQALEDAVRSLNGQIDDWSSTRPTDDPVVRQRRAQVEKVAAEYRASPPPEVTEKLRSPWPSEKVFRLIAQKTWRLLIAQGGDQFVTSDNPAYFFEGYGLGDSRSELTFPLSPDLALLANWQGERSSMSSVVANPGLVREMNRRLVSSAERFVFSSAPQRWLQKVAGKSRPYISRVQW